MVQMLTFSWKRLVSHNSWNLEVEALFFFFFKFYFILSYIALQHCICFAIHWHESASGVHEFPIMNPPSHLPPYHLSGSSPCTSPKHPVSCIEHRLAIHFLHDSIHVSMPFSQITSPSPSPSESKSLFYTSVSLAVLHTGSSLPSL